MKTSDIARAAGIHPNTVRLYEQLGFLPAPRRDPNGYRRYTRRHLDQTLLIRSLTRCTWLGGAIRQAALDAINLAAKGETAEALAAAQQNLALVQGERARAERAVTLLEGVTADGLPQALTIQEAASWLAVTPDTLRNWDKNGLLKVPRHPSSGYRVYGPAQLQRLLIIRALRKARYSVAAIHRMFRQIEADSRTDPRLALDTLPPGEEDIFYSTDRWLTRVKEVEQFACEAVERLSAKAPRASEKD